MQHEVALQMVGLVAGLDMELKVFEAVASAKSDTVAVSLGELVVGETQAKVAALLNGEFEVEAVDHVDAEHDERAELFA